MKQSKLQAHRFIEATTPPSISIAQKISDSGLFYSDEVYCHKLHEVWNTFMALFSANRWIYLRHKIPIDHFDFVRYAREPLRKHVLWIFQGMEKEYFGSMNMLQRYNDVYRRLATLVSGHADSYGFSVCSKFYPLNELIENEPVEAIKSILVTELCQFSLDHKTLEEASLNCKNFDAKNDYIREAHNEELHSLVNAIMRL